MTCWYRIEDWATAPGVDEWGDVLPGPGGIEVALRKFEVIKETPTGAWLRTGWSIVDMDEPAEPDRRWCRRDCHKRFACPTIQEALESFVARKRRQASIYRARAKHADEAIHMAWRRYGPQLESREPMRDRR